MPVFEPTVEQQIKELKAAGWEPKTRTIWKAPNGALFLGPHGAWKRMKAHKKLYEIERAAREAFHASV